jgi:hypothetical protein
MVCSGADLAQSEIEGNCNLIAAAPELLAALKIARASTEFYTMLPDERDAINAAIAKAESL